MPDISRADAAALIERQNFNEVLQEAVHGSAALSTFRTINMGSSTGKFYVLSTLPTAGFVAEGSAKPTTDQVWADRVITAEEIAAIVPIHENVFEDTEISIWDEVRPRIAEAFGAVLDGAVFFGTNKPASWPNSLEDGARAAGNIRSAAAAGDLVEDISQTWALVEADGFDVNVNYAHRSIRATLRGLRDTSGQPLLQTSLADNPGYSVYGEDLYFVTNGAWVAATAGPPAAGATLIAGDRTKAVLGIRTDVQYKILDQATVGGFNLAELDMIALRAKFRVGFQTAEHRTIEGGATAYPFAILDL